MTNNSTQKELLSAPIMISESVIGCDGSALYKGNASDGAMKHPLVYLNLKPEQPTTCPYCSCQFQKKL